MISNFLILNQFSIHIPPKIISSQCTLMIFRFFCVYPQLFQIKRFVQKKIALSYRTFVKRYFSLEWFSSMFIASKVFMLYHAWMLCFRQKKNRDEMRKKNKGVKYEATSKQAWYTQKKSWNIFYMHHIIIRKLNISHINMFSCYFYHMNVRRFLFTFIASFWMGWLIMQLLGFFYRKWKFKRQPVVLLGFTSASFYVAMFTTFRDLRLNAVALIRRRWSKLCIQKGKKKLKIYVLWCCLLAICKSKLVKQAFNLYKIWFFKSLK